MCEGHWAVSPLRLECYEGDSRDGRPCAFKRYARKSFGLVEVDRWQVSHLVLGETEPDAVRNACHGIDRNGDPLLAPNVALVEQDVCHVMIAGIDDQSLDPPDASNFVALKAAHSRG